MRTYSPKPGDITREWHVIDATDVVLGRLAFQTANLLRGKHKPIFAPHVDTGDFVIIVNAEKVALSGDKKTTSFTPSAKIAYLAAGKNAFGVEYYLEAPRGSSREEQSHMLYFAWDGKLGKSDLNVGVGRGLNDASDRWVLKMIYEIAF